MAGCRHHERVPKPRALVGVEAWYYRFKVRGVLRRRRFGLVEQDDFRSEIRRERADAECRSELSPDSGIATKDPFTRCAVMFVQQKLELISVGPGDVDFVDW